MMYEYWFARIEGVGHAKKRKLREQVSSAKELFNMEETRLLDLGAGIEESRRILEAQKEKNIVETYEKMKAQGIDIVPFWSAKYPRRLHFISSTPYAVYVKGHLPEEEKLSVAIVGARECTAYGKSIAKELGQALGEAGVQIISGMARGIDGIAQRGALNGKGTSFGILGCGVDVCYPREHIELYMDLQKNGGILSELAPGTKPLRQFFPARNRLISGLADIVIVVEAREKSGSLITADMALEQGKDVYAVPGPISSVLSRGCNALIRQGAGILSSVDDFMEELQLLRGENLSKLDEKNFLLESAENIVYSCLGFHPLSLGELVSSTKMTIPELLRILLKLELHGYIQEISKNYYVRI